MIHTPYDGSAKPFTIGLKPLDLNAWIDRDEKFDLYLAEKKRLYAEEWHNVYASIGGLEHAEREVLELLTAHLARLNPGLRRDDEAETTDGGRALPALARAGLLVQEDLVLMVKRGEEWCLGAASLCFPSAWSLREKIGKPMHDVHGPVPGFNAGTRNAALIERMFDKLTPAQGVLRWNWTLFGETQLYHPATDGGVKRRFGQGEVAEKVTLRLERQTLRKLPQSGTILFTIRTYMDPIEVLQDRADGPQLVQSIIAQIEAFSPEELAYKGLTDEKQRLLARLYQLTTHQTSGQVSLTL